MKETGGSAVPIESMPAQPSQPRRRRRLPVAALLAWTVFAFVVPRLVQPLNVVDVFAFPLGFFMVAQGSLLAFLVIAVVSARRQDRIDAVTDGR